MRKKPTTAKKILILSRKKADVFSLWSISKTIIALKMYFSSGQFLLYNIQVLHAVDATTASVDVADHITHKLLWGGDFELHDWLEQNGLGLLDTLTSS